MAAGSVVDGRTVEDVALGGVPKTVLADRMGCLKAGVAANVVVPTADYVRFATHYGFRPDFCEGGDPESKGIVEALVGYAKRDLVVPARAKTAEEKRFLALGEVAVAVLTGAAAIASTLLISVKTLERHRANILARLDMRDRTKLSRYAIRAGHEP